MRPKLEGMRGNYERRGGGSRPASRLFEWSTCCHGAPLDMHQRYNKRASEHILSRPRTNWMFMRSFLWGFSSCTRGWSDCVGSRHLFFPPIHYKGSSVTCDPSPPSSWETRLELDVNAAKIRRVVCFFSSLPFLLITASLRPWWAHVTVKQMHL